MSSIRSNEGTQNSVGADKQKAKREYLCPLGHRATPMGANLLLFVCSECKKQYARTDVTLRGGASGEAENEAKPESPSDYWSRSRPEDLLPGGWKTE